MNRILDLQAILPSIDLGAALEDSGGSVSCASGNCNSGTSVGCQDQTIATAVSPGFF